MPPVSTHVNFARMFQAGTESRDDACSFALGAVAPDCYDREDDQSFRTYHFVVYNSLPDLDYFLKTTISQRRSHDANALSFIEGSYSHLWLDRFFPVHGAALRVANPSDLPPNELRSLVRENVEEYDLADTATFLETMKKVPLLPEPIQGLEFVSFDCAAHLLRQLTKSSPGIRERHSLHVAVSRDDYSRFLESALQEFVAAIASLNRLNGA